MKKGRFESSASAKKHTKKVVALLLVMLLLVGSVVGTTLAWLTDTAETVTDTFTVGNVSIELYQGDTATTWKDANHSLKMMPGQDIAFNPNLEVAANSEACYLFVKVEATAPVVNYLTYDIIEDADAWTQLDGVANVYYREVASLTTAQRFDIFDGEVVTVLEDVDKVALEAAGETVKISVTGYAAQQEGFVDAKAAWTECFAG